jgi:hypothetical protein
MMAFLDLTKFTRFWHFLSLFSFDIWVIKYFWSLAGDFCRNVDLDDLPDLLLMDLELTCNLPH